MERNVFKFNILFDQEMTHHGVTFTHFMTARNQMFPQGMNLGSVGRVAVVWWSIRVHGATRNMALSQERRLKPPCQVGR